MTQEEKDQLQRLELVIALGEKHHLRRVVCGNVEVEFADAPSGEWLNRPEEMSPEAVAAAEKALTSTAPVCPCGCGPWEHDATGACLNGHPEKLCGSKDDEAEEEPA